MEPSYWFHEVPDTKRFPSLEGNLRVDVAVVGAGVAGLSAAYFLAKAGKKVALIEAEHIVTGDTGYTTAFASHFLDSTDVTVRGWEASDRAIRLLKETALLEKISCDWEDVDGIEFSHKADLSEFRRDYDAFVKIDGSIEYREGEQTTEILGFPANAVFRKAGSEGQFHIRKFLIGLAERAKNLGVEIFEESEVTGFAPGAPVAITTKNGSVESDWLVVAAGNPPKKLFPEVAKHLTPSVTYVLHVRFPEGKPFGKKLLWDDLLPYHYFRWLNDEELILGGEDRVLSPGSSRPSGDPHQALETWLRGIAGPNPFSVVNRWQGSLFSTPDIFPILGPHSAYGENVIFLTGWGGNGITLGFLSGAIAHDIIEKREFPFRDLFSINRLNS